MVTSLVSIGESKFLGFYINNVLIPKSTSFNSRQLTENPVFLFLLCEVGGGGTVDLVNYFAYENLIPVIRPHKRATRTESSKMGLIV